MEDVSHEQLNIIQKRLTENYEDKESVFKGVEEDPIVKKYVEEVWQRMIAFKEIDFVSVDKQARMGNADTL